MTSSFLAPTKAVFILLGPYSSNLPRERFGNIPIVRSASLRRKDRGDPLIDPLFPDLVAREDEQHDLMLVEGCDKFIFEGTNSDFDWLLVYIDKWKTEGYHPKVFYKMADLHELLERNRCSEHPVEEFMIKEQKEDEATILKLLEITKTPVEIV